MEHREGLVSPDEVLVIAFPGERGELRLMRIQVRLSSVREEADLQSGDSVPAQDMSDS
jgi:hypothetical protein